MKLVTAVITPAKLDDVRAALTAAGVAGMTVGEVSGFGHQGGHQEVYRGDEYQVDTVPKVRIDVLVDDAGAPGVVAAIVAAARTGSVGDGKIWTTSVEDVVRVRTGEHGPGAI